MFSSFPVFVVFKGYIISGEGGSLELSVYVPELHPTGSEK
jgi:hypothetical protein